MTPIPIEGDLNETEAWSGFVPLRPGDHLVECISAEEGTSTNGHPQIQLELQAVAGDEKGAGIRDWIVVTASTYGKVKQVLLAFGLSIPEPGGSISGNAFVGKRARIVVRPEEKKDGSGEMTNRVKGYNPVSGGDEAVSKVQQAFPGATETSRDDDIPF